MNTKQQKIFKSTICLFLLFLLFFTAKVIIAFEDLNIPLFKPFMVDADTNKRLDIGTENILVTIDIPTYLYEEEGEELKVDLRVSRGKEVIFQRENQDLRNRLVNIENGEERTKSEYLFSLDDPLREKDEVEMCFVLLPSDDGGCMGQAIGKDMSDNNTSSQSLSQTQGRDISELMLGSASENLKAGDLVAISHEKLSYGIPIVKTTQVYQKGLIGVVATNPSGITLGQGLSEDIDYKPFPLALVGTVSVKVSTENGPIEPGDPITSSSMGGVGMKATLPGPVIGKALEFFDEPEVGKIMVLINLGWYSPPLDSTGSLQVSKNDSLTPSTKETESGLFSGLLEKAWDAISGVPKLIVNGILEVKNNIVTHGVFKSIVKVAKTVVEGRTVTIERDAALAQNSELEIESEDEQSVSFVTYSILSPRKEIMVSGSGEFVKNRESEVEAKIAFHPSFSAIISEKVPIRVIVTPTSYINGHLYVAEKSIQGFTVKELHAQDPGVRFDWLVTAGLIDPEQAQQALEKTEIIANQENNSASSAGSNSSSQTSQTSVTSPEQTVSPAGSTESVTSTGSIGSVTTTETATTTGIATITEINGTQPTSTQTTSTEATITPETNITPELTTTDATGATSTEATTEAITATTKQTCQPSQEVCDGVDNDCDGEVDEDLTQQCGSTDIGAYQFGTQTCQAEIWGECQGAVEPTREICGDNLDNNCDGQTDEGCQLPELPTPESTSTTTTTTTDEETL